MMQLTVMSDIFNYFSSISTPAFMGDISYSPYDENDIKNFIEDYKNNFKNFDLLNKVRYLSREYIVPFNVGTDISIISNDFKNLSTAYITGHLDDLHRLYYALNLKYNPIFNLDVKSTITKKGKDVDESGTTSTNKTGDLYNESGTDTNIFGEQIQNNKNVTNDSLELVDTDSTVLNSHTDTTNYGKKTTTNLTDTTTHGRVNSIDLTDTEIRQGNQGVTMSQQMLEAEYRIRQKNFFDDLFYKIINEFTIY